MAISDNYVPLKELGNSTTTEFSGDWAVIAASFLRVFLEDVITGVQVLQTEGADYTLVFSDNGFTVTFLVAPTSADYVVIGREIAETQTVPYKTSKGFQGFVQEDSFDKLTAMSQDQSDEIDRSLKFPLGSGSVGSLPNPIDDIPVGWDSTGGALKNNSKTLTEINDAVDAVGVLVAASGVKVSANDTTVGYLNGKLVAGDIITLTENNNGSNESLTVSIVDGAVTNAKLADMAQATIKGRASASGTGDPVDLTSAQVRTIIGSATDTQEGMVELATVAEAQAGTDAIRAITPVGLAGSMIGSVDQSWVDVSGSRAVDTTYTNTTGAPIMVVITIIQGAGTNGAFIVDGVTIAQQIANGIDSTTSFIVPDGNTYRYTKGSGTTIIRTWAELS